MVKVNVVGNFCLHKDEKAIIQNWLKELEKTSEKIGIDFELKIKSLFNYQIIFKNKVKYFEMPADIYIYLEGMRDMIDMIE